MTSWQYYPKSDQIPGHLLALVTAFTRAEANIGSVQDTGESDLSSNLVLAAMRDDLLALGYLVEAGKKAHDKIHVPVLFGRNGRVEKSFDADAFELSTGTVLEIEAGRGLVNNAFLKDLFEACMMQDVAYAAIAVRNVYKNSRDFEKVLSFFDTLYASRRLALPLQGVLIIGY
jgi:hypothetical protein